MGPEDHAIWWQIYPLGAVGAPIREQHDDAVVHRLGMLEAWLDYAVELGCSGILLAPIFASRAHGYDTLDHLRLDPRLGDDADFDHFVAACRERGLLVMLDGVFNHVSVDHPWAQAALRGESSPVAVDVIDNERRLRAWEGHGELVELDHTSAEARDLVTKIMLHWLRRGISGWRLDVAYAVDPAFWRDCIARVREEFPDAMFLGEVIHGDYVHIAQESTFTSVTQYELWKAIWSSIHDTNCWELAWALQRHEEFCASFLPNTFVGNHDVARIASLVGDTGAALGAVVLFTVPGMPSIYYGDEQGFHGGKGEGFSADDSIRPPLPATPGELLPYGAWLYRHYQELIALRRRNPWLTRGALDVTDKTNESLDYVVRGDGHEARVSLRLDTPQASITIDGDEAFRWGG